MKTQMTKNEFIIKLCLCIGSLIGIIMILATH